jgi:eukaryotic-like serine/threonine-protein kinase
LSTRTLIRTLTLPYESLRTIYEGGCEVRLYRNEITGKLQVGKRIDTLGLEDAVAFREGTLLTTIRHPNLVPVLDVVDVSGYPAPMKTIELIMPYYERGSVFDAFERGERFSVGEARSLVGAALLGLAELHDVQRILHRDLKSPNVFLDDDGALRVGDLGVAVPMTPDGTAEAYLEAQLYSPPETFVADLIGPAADVYQMGMVLLEMVNGPFPYGDYPRSEVAVRLAKGRRGPRPVDLELRPHVPKRLRSVLHKALAVRPHDRYQSAREMSQALSRVPLVDWQLVVDETDRRIWEGACVARPDRRYRVDAHRMPRRGWVLRGLQQVSRWQRVTGLPDQAVPDPASPLATGFFDAIVTIAHRR